MKDECEDVFHLRLQSQGRIFQLMPPSSGYATSILVCSREVLISIWFWPNPNYQAGPAAVQLVGLQCHAPGAQSWCTETCCVRSRIPGDRLNADPGSVGSSHSRWQVDCARLDEGVSSRSRWQ